MKPRMTVLVLGAIALAGSSAMPTLATSPTPASGTTWNPNQRVEYRWRAGDEPPTWLRPAINRAADDSNASRDSRAAYLAYAADGDSWVGYTSDLPTNWAVGYTTRNVPHSFTVRLRPHGYPLDWGTLRWCEFYDDPPTGCYDAEMITLHEFGHAMTLGHADEADVTSWTDSIMHASPKTKAKAGWNAHEYGVCDVARLQIRYEALTASTRYSTCLDLETELSLSSSATSAPFYGQVTLTARLKISDQAIYPNLASDPLAGRRVNLQRRPAGQTAWTTVSELDSVTGDPGRYSAKVTINAVYDWRAVFNTPSSEGLRSSASQAVRVSLSYDCAPTSSPSREVAAQAIC
jgi:hypothetical protein